MLPSQKYFIRNHLISKWKFRDQNFPSANDISFNSEDNSINSVTTDLTWNIKDKFIYVYAGTSDSENISGYYKINTLASNTATKLYLDSEYRTINADKAAGTFIQLYPLISAIKWPNSFFIYPEDRNDIFIEYLPYYGSAVPYSKMADAEGTTRQKKDGFLKFLLHIPYDDGEALYYDLIARLLSMFCIGNIGSSIHVSSIEEGGGFKDDQKEYWIISVIVYYRCYYDERQLRAPFYNSFNQQGFPQMNFTLPQSNTFQKLSAVNLNTTTGLYELTTTDNLTPASHIIIDRNDNNITLQNSGPVQYITPHGMPTGKIAYLINPESPSSINYTFTKPTSGKYQVLFEVPNAYTISIGISDVVEL